MKFKTESRFLYYLLLFHSWVFLNPVRCDDKDTITMVSVLVNTENSEKGKFVHVCGGLLITNSVIFTGCSCITSVPGPTATDKDKVDLLTPDQVRVNAGVSEASKKGQTRMQSAVAYALSVHDLCDSTYVYNYGMVKLTTSFVLENGLELSHALSLDMTNFEKNLKSMGPKDCWTEIWTSVESPGKPSNATSTVTVTMPSSTPKTTPMPDSSEYNDTMEATGEEGTGEEESADSGSPPDTATGSEELSGESGDDGSGSKTTFGHLNTGGGGNMSSNTTSKSDTASSLPVTAKEASVVATVKPTNVSFENSSPAVLVASDEAEMPGTFEPQESMGVNVSTLPPVLSTGGLNATVPAENETNTTGLIHGNETISNGTDGGNQTAEPEGMGTSNDSSASNLPAAAGAANATAEGGAPEANDSPETAISSSKYRRRRSDSLDTSNVSYYGTFDLLIPLRTNTKLAKEKRQAVPDPGEVPPEGSADATSGSSNDTEAGGSPDGMNGTGGANASSAPGGINGTEVGPASNASDSSVDKPSSNATGGGNDTDISPSHPVVNNTSDAVNETGSGIEIMDNGTASTDSVGNKTVVNVTTVENQTTAGSLVTGTVTVEVMVTGKPLVTDAASKIPEGPEGISGDGDKDASGEPPPPHNSGSGDEGGSGESGEEDGSGNSPSDVSPELPPDTEVSMAKPSKKPPPPPPPPPPKPPKSDSGPPSGETPRGVGRMPVSILDWKECGSLVCPNPSEKCDSSNDDTKWCLSALKEGARVCKADTGSPVYCKSSLIGILSNVGLTCPEDTTKGIAVGLDQAFEYIKSMMGMPDFQKKVPPAETKQRKSGSPKELSPSIHAVISFIIAILLI